MYFFYTLVSLTVSLRRKSLYIRYSCAVIQVKAPV